MNYSNHLSVKSSQEVQELCTHLVERFNITGFCYDMSFPDGELSMLTDNLSLFESFYSRDFNPVCSNNKGRTLIPGLYTTSMLFNKNEDKRSFTYIESLFQTSFGVHFIERLNGYDEMVSFALDMTPESFDYFILNHQVHLKNFIRYFRESMSETIGQLTNKENRLFFPDVLTNTKQQNTMDTHNKTKTASIILANGLSVTLTPQQSACLKLLIEDKSLKEITKELYLSTRTVEHYLSAARNKLSCSTLLSLVNQYGEQIR